MKRFGMAEMISGLLIAEADIGQAAAHQQNIEVLRNRRGMQPHRYGNSSRSGAGAAGRV